MNKSLISMLHSSLLFFNMSCLAGEVISNRVHNAEELERALRRQGFTNVWVSTTFSEHTHIRGPSVSNITEIGNMKDFTPYLTLDQTQVSDLTPLRRLPIKGLIIQDGPNISDHSLHSLSNTGLEVLALINTRVSDLSSLKGMPLHTLELHHSTVSSVSVVATMPLVNCILVSNKISDVSVLNGKASLRHVTIMEPAVTNISALRGLPLRFLCITGSGIRDMKPVEDAPLERVRFNVKTVTNGLDVVRSMRTLKEINCLSAEDFWAAIEGRLRHPSEQE